MVSKQTSRETTPEQGKPAMPPATAVGWQRYPILPLCVIAVFLAFVLCPRVRTNANLVTTFYGVGAALLFWTAILWAGAKRWPQCFRIEGSVVRKNHYIQASVQLCVYVVWGWYWPNVYAEAPLFVAQLLFLYTFDALLSWSRGRSWRFGFGPLPIILSTNVFIWFKDDWYIYQFLLIATGALGKEFIKWTREGKTTHVFNPSAFTLGLFSIVLIATKTTNYTWGVEVAATLGRPPHMYLVIFCLGLIVQYFFAVTLMTVSAVATLYLLNVIYTGTTGVYQFLDTNIPIAVFLGLHLLVTDPSTSPRTNAGKIIFGSLYGLGNFVLYDWLAAWGAPEFYDKLLPVPILNMSVQLIDRLANMGAIARFTRWESSFQPRKVNLVHMGFWIVLFATMVSTGFLGGPHAGSSIDFWRKAYAAGRPHAGEKLLKLASAQAETGSAAACNELGAIYMEGKLAPSDHGVGAHYFASACELGDPHGCANVATQFLFFHEASSDAVVTGALAELEHGCGQGTDGRGCFLVGFAYETGRFRPNDRTRALELYREAGRLGSLDAAKGIARIRLSVTSGQENLSAVAQTLEQACDAGDSESCLYLESMCQAGTGIPRDEQRARALLDKACKLGSLSACEALKRANPLPFSLSVAPLPPAWSR